MEEITKVSSPHPLPGVSFLGQWYVHVRWWGILGRSWCTHPASSGIHKRGEAQVTAPHSERAPGVLTPSTGSTELHIRKERARGGNLGCLRSGHDANKLCDLGQVIEPLELVSSPITTDVGLYNNRWDVYN